MRPIACLLLATLALAACGDDDERPADPEPAGAELRLAFREDQGADERILTFRCPGDGCAGLERIDRQALAPVSGDVACTEIYGGAQLARLTGTLDGRAVDAEFSRSNGCEIHRWERVIAALAPDLPVGASPPPAP